MNLGTSPGGDEGGYPVGVPRGLHPPARFFLCAGPGSRPTLRTVFDTDTLGCEHGEAKGLEVKSPGHSSFANPKNRGLVVRGFEMTDEQMKTLIEAAKKIDRKFFDVLFEK